MYIKFKVIRWRNLLATGNTWTEIELDRHERTLIYGENGHGKSTMLDALTFVLFGRAFRNLNKPLLVNSINGEDCVVELEFIIGTNHYKIIRGIKPNFFEVYCNGQMKDQNAGVYDYQDYLEKNILKFNFKTFRQIMALGSKAFVPFMQLVALDRRNVIEELLDIQIFSAMAKVTRNKLDHLRERLNEVNLTIKNTQEKIELQHTNILHNTSQNEAMIETNLQTIANGEDFIKLYQIEIKNNEVAITILAAIVSDHQKILGKLTELQQLESAMKHNHNKYLQQHKFFYENDSCPTCKQPIDATFKEVQLEEHQVKVLDLEIGLLKIGNLITEITEQVKVITQANNEIRQHDANINENLVKIEQLKNWNQKLLDENSNLVTLILGAEHNDVQLQRLIKELEIEEIKKTHLMAAKRYLEVSASLLKDGGIKASIIKQYLPIMNNFINKYLSYMDFFAQFTLDENFEESILARHRDKFAYESFSNGQQLRIDLALLFAWRSVAKVKNSVDTNILIMDEIIDSSLDNQGVEDFFKLILAFRDTNIFIISPKGDTLLDKFDHNIKFELKSNFSEIVS